MKQIGHLALLWPVAAFIVGLLLKTAGNLETGGSYLAAASVTWAALSYANAAASRLLWEKQVEYRMPIAFVLSLASLAYLVGDSARLYGRRQKAQALRVHMSGCELTSTATETNMFWVEYHGPQGLTLARVNLIITFDVTNNSKDPLLLGDFEVQYSDGLFSDWKILDVLSDGRIFTPNPKNPDIHASIEELVLSPMSVNRLFRQPIDPEKNVPAYAFIKYPAGFDLEGRKMRLKVCDADNNCVYNKINAKSLGPKPGGCLFMKPQPDYVDLSHHHLEQ